MTSYEMSIVLQEVIHAIETASVPRNLAAFLDAQYLEVAEVATVIIGREVSSKTVTELLNKTDDLLEEAKVKIRSYKPSEVLIALHNWATALNLTTAKLQLPVSLQAREEVLDPLIFRVRAFQERYEDVLQNPARRNVMYLIFAAHELLQVTKAISFLGASVHEALRITKSPDEGFEQLDILFLSRSNLTNLIRKLSALESLYSELCRLLDISTSEYPLELIKLEAGSIWLKVFGESRVISLITKFLESTTSYLYRNFTVEGKISAIPQNAQTIDALLQLSKRLEESGIDSAFLKENIKQSAIILGQQLNQFLAGEPNMNINGRKHSVGEELKEKYLQESRTLLIGDGADDGPAETV